MAGHEAWSKRAVEEIDAAHDLRATGKRLQAYHHAGQAVEFALKAIYIKRKGLAELPADCQGANWHNLASLAISVLDCEPICTPCEATKEGMGTG
jgi:hypothetical protein